MQMLKKPQCLHEASATCKTIVSEEWDFKRFDPFLKEVIVEIPVDYEGVCPGLNKSHCSVQKW